MAAAFIAALGSASIAAAQAGPPTPNLCPKSHTATYFVRADSRQGRGTPAEPFATLEQALAEATRAELCDLELQVAPGRYSGPIPVTRPTRISRWGSGVTCLQGTLANPQGMPLSVENIEFCQAPELAIDQRGGWLQLTHVRIHHTLRQAATAESGTALRLSEGAQVVLRNVELSANEGQAIHARDPNTRIWADGLRVLQNQVNPRALRDAVINQYAFVPTLEIHRQARLWARNFEIRGNEVSGLRVHHEAQAFLEKGSLGETRAAATAPPELRGGVNLSVAAGATVELRDFVSEKAELAGLHVSDAYLTLSNGEVQNNAIGAGISGTPLQPTFCLYDEVRYRDNGRNFAFPPGEDADCESHPTSAGCSGDLRLCRRVPWINPPL